MNLTDYAKYGLSIRTSSYEGVEYYMVTLTFGKKWRVLEPTVHPEMKVMCAKIKEDGTYCYMTESSNGIEPIFELIDDTIHYNEELEMKVEFLKVKAEELKELFATKGYDELLRLRFVIETPQEAPAPKNKRQPNSRKKTPQNQNTEPAEAKSDTPQEPIGEPIPEPVSGQQKPKVKDDDPPLEPVNKEPSDIDKKIAEAMKYKA